MLTPPAKLYKFEEFEKIFDPSIYFENYYGLNRMDEFEKESMPFLLKTLTNVLKLTQKNEDKKTFEETEKKRFLQVGFSSAGILLPILVQKFFDEIQIFENSSKCFEELIKWKNQHSQAFDWQPFVDQMQQRGLEIDNDVIAMVTPIDDPSNSGKYDLVASMFHMESRNGSQKLYSKTVKKMFQAMKKGGFYLQAGMLNQCYYDAGKNQYFVSLPIEKQQILDIFYDVGLDVKSWNDFEVPYCNASRTTTSPGASMYLCLAQRPL